MNGVWIWINFRIGICLKVLSKVNWLKSIQRWIFICYTIHSAFKYFWILCKAFKFIQLPETTLSAWVRNPFFKYVTTINLSEFTSFPKRHNYFTCSSLFLNNCWLLFNLFKIYTKNEEFSHIFICLAIQD